MKNNIELAKRIMGTFDEHNYHLGKELINAMIKDGYEMSSDWTLFEIPIREVYVFTNDKENKAFDMLYDEENMQWKPGYVTIENNRFVNKYAPTIKEAIKLNEILGSEKYGSVLLIDEYPRLRNI